MDPEQIAKLIIEDELWEKPAEEAINLIYKDLEARGYSISFHRESDSCIILGDSDEYYGVMRVTHFQRVLQRMSQIEMTIFPKGYGDRAKFTRRTNFDIYDGEAMGRALNILDTYVGNK